MNQFKIFIVLCIILISCNKENTPTFVNQYDDEIIKYVIHVDQSVFKITDYSKYINDQLVEMASYESTDTAVVRLTKDSADRISKKSIFILGENGLAESCTDSSFNENGLYIAKRYFEYENDYMIMESIHWENFGAVPGSGQALKSRVIENENIQSINITVPQNPGGCTDNYAFNTKINMIDIIDFSNGITGRISKNLIKYVSWNNGCPGGPSMSISSSDFEYEMDQNGFVKKMTEIYTPSYHLSYASEVTRTIRTTIYEYKSP